VVEASGVRIEDFDFELPKAQIAQSPLSRRDASKLMVVDQATGGFAHRHFAELPALLREGDLLVVNDTRVIPARLIGKKAGTGGRVELLLVRPAAAPSSGRPNLEAADQPCQPDQPDQSEQSEQSAGEAAAGEAADEAAHEAAHEAADEWVCLGQASKGLKPGARLEFSHGLSAEVVEAAGGGEYRVRFFTESAAQFLEVLGRAGHLPLPPYIERAPTADDAERYQTVFASVPGSVAAPTAGLHFTPEVLAALEARGVGRVAVTLDVGPGTFLPVRDGDLEHHKMHSERFDVPRATAAAIGAARASGRRVVAVGTTVVRCLESATDAETGALRPGAGETAIFIRPGYTFRQVDALLTNFHLPRSTLLMLVSAFLGREQALAAYRAAVASGYRFFSYGDAMFIEKARRG
jgi:S-adenosylmethionine:tRNA ribosyltransferase-isomerase